MAEVSDDRLSKMNASLFTSTTDEWATPLDFFAMLDAEFDFTLDVCATAFNTKCQAYFSKDDDGLSRKWVGTCWMNPPYGRVIGDWVKKAYEESLAGATVVCLIPARTDTAYWHDYAMKADEIRLVRGRLHFGGGDTDSKAHNAPFPQAVVVFRPPLAVRRRREGTLLSTIGRRAEAVA